VTDCATETKPCASISRVLPSILDEYALPLDGHYGVGRWAHLFENGLRLAEMTGADVDVFQLFDVR
jgi:hypothetical protein